tara:strand:- start:135 stop:482 length:348 start_codon:yes stop_codon:yes gene_type:complete
MKILLSVVLFTFFPCTSLSPCLLSLLLPVVSHPCTLVLARAIITDLSYFLFVRDVQAKYVYAGIQKATQYGMTCDEDIIVLHPTPDYQLPIYVSNAGWNDKANRCVYSHPEVRKK